MTELELQFYAACHASAAAIWAYDVERTPGALARKEAAMQAEDAAWKTLQQAKQVVFNAAV